MSRLITALLLSLLPLLSAPASSADVAKHGSWQRSCKEGACILSQGLTNPDKPGIIYSTQFQRINDGKQLVMQLNLPLGIYLPPGLGLEIGSVRKDLPVAVCIPNGCKALLPVDGPLEQQLRSADSLKLRFHVNESTSNELVFPLTGIATGLDSLTP